MILLIEARGHDNLESLLKNVTWDNLIEVPGLDKYPKKKTPWEEILLSGTRLSYETEFDKAVNDFLQKGAKQQKILSGIYAIASEPNLQMITVFGNTRQRYDGGSKDRKDTLGPLYAFDFQGGGRVVYRAKGQNIRLCAIGIESGSGGGVWEPVKRKGL